MLCPFSARKTGVARSAIFFPLSLLDDSTFSPFSLFRSSQKSWRTLFLFLPPKKAPRGPGVFLFARLIFFFPQEGRDGTLSTFPFRGGVDKKTDFFSLLFLPIFNRGNGSLSKEISPTFSFLMGGGLILLIFPFFLPANDTSSSPPPFPPLLISASPPFSFLFPRAPRCRSPLLWGVTTPPCRRHRLLPLFLNTGTLLPPWGFEKESISPPFAHYNDFFFFVGGGFAFLPLSPHVPPPATEEKNPFLLLKFSPPSSKLLLRKLYLPPPPPPRTRRIPPLFPLPVEYQIWSSLPFPVQTRKKPVFFAVSSPSLPPFPMSLAPSPFPQSRSPFPFSLFSILGVFTTFCCSPLWEFLFFL